MPLIELVAIEHRRELLLAAIQRTQAFTRMARRMKYSSLNYFSAAFSDLQKIRAALARLARALQSPG